MPIHPIWPMPFRSSSTQIVLVAGLGVALSSPIATATAVTQRERPSDPLASPNILISQRLNTEFPLPDSVQNFQTLPGPGENTINFQTGLGLEEAIAFYRQQFTELGLTEREINTAITDSTFSMIFDTWPNGKPVVIQGVSLGETTNINIRHEDV